MIKFLSLLWRIFSKVSLIDLVLDSGKLIREVPLYVSEIEQYICSMESVFTYAGANPGGGTHRLRCRWLGRTDFLVSCYIFEAANNHHLTVDFFHYGLAVKSLNCQKALKPTTL